MNFNEEINNIKPSQLYKHLQRLCSPNMPASVVRSLWLNQLPLEVQMILAPMHSKKIEEITAAADSIMDVINKTPKKLNVRELLIIRQLDALTNTVEKLSSDVQRFSTRYHRALSLTPHYKIKSLTKVRGRLEGIRRSSSHTCLGRVVQYEYDSTPKSRKKT